MLIVYILTGLVLFFGYIICMAIANGLHTEMMLDIDPSIGESGTYRPKFQVNKAYRQKHPKSTKPLQGNIALIAAIIIFTALIFFLYYVSTHPA